MGDELVQDSIELHSDAQGWVRLTGRTGKTLDVESVEKEGYLWSSPPLGSFAYEPTGRRVGYIGMEAAFDSSKGYVFHMWKKGVTERLVQVEHRVGVDPFGTNWYAVNIFRGSVQSTAEADFRFWFATVSDSEGHPMRRFRFEGIRGGLVVHTNPYPYMAPTSGYASAWEWTYEPQGRDRTKSADEALKHVFYLSARNGKIYAAITWDWPSENSVRIVGYVNPNGSRNLEPDAGKQITDPEEIRRLDAETAMGLKP